MFNKVHIYSAINKYKVNFSIIISAAQGFTGFMHSRGCRKAYLVELFRYNFNNDDSV